ncbi:hypothetical protein HDU92_002732 [Lobulomyces angularis]|nr:hypothetical protein HDU92_002732 [Lobulomyces angularis]
MQQASNNIIQKFFQNSILTSTCCYKLSPLSFQIRGAKHSSKQHKLVGYILPKQKRKSSMYTKSLKFKWFRLKAGVTGQRERQPGYGRNDKILSKMNI